MQQSLIAMAALLTVTLLSFSQQQAHLRNQEQIFRSEMQQMALGVAKQTLEVVRAQQFDANIDPEDPDMDDIPDKFASSDEFGSEGECGALLEGASDTDCEAVEDFHEASGAVPFELPDGGALSFSVEVEVYYVCPPDMARVEEEGDCDAPTRYKEVVVKVRDDPENREPWLQERVSFSEVLAFS